MKTLEEYEREYGDVYTKEEFELNKKLYTECVKLQPDFDAIEKLLQQGADPLGGTAASGWDLLDHVYGEFVYGSMDDNSVHLPRMTELFLQYGMDVERPRIPYDGSNSIHPLWNFGYVMNENAIVALKMLLDKGLSAEAVEEMQGLVIGDMRCIECGDPNDGGFWQYRCLWTMKMLMLCASYPHVLDNSEELRDFIGYSYNAYDLGKFRQWDDFDYEFDTSTCKGEPDFCGSVVRIYEKETQQPVWTVAV